MDSPVRIEDCYHCGEPIPPGLDLHASIMGQAQPVCCRGCQAVAQLISGAGLDRFYQFREGPSRKPAPQHGRRWLAWDRDVLADQVAPRVPDDAARRELLVGVENIHCAACAWLIERLLKSLPGITSVQVNAATATLRVLWEDARTPLSELFTRLDQAGYPPRPLVERGESRQRERRRALKRLGVAGLGMMQVMMYAVALYAGAFQGIEPGMERFLRFVSLAIATPVVLYSGWPFFRGAWRDLRALRPGMDVPVALAIGGAFTASVINTLRGAGDVYFDSATMFVFFLSVARYLEMHARHRSQSVADGVAGALPDLAERLSPDRDAWGDGEWVTPAELRASDRVRLGAGDAVPADGLIESGGGAVSEALLSGESSPLDKATGDEVRAGSSVVDGQFILRVTRSGGATLLAQIGRLLERARSERPPVAALADRIARWFVAAVLVITTGVGIVWSQIDSARTFEVVLATLVVTCPCALSLATPAALAAATAGLARCGILIVSGGALESLARVRALVLDKTGTLTDPEPRLLETHPCGALSGEQALALAASLESGSRHPLARAFSGIQTANRVEHVDSHPGSGLEAEIDGDRWRLGRIAWVAALAGADPGSRTAHTNSVDAHATWLALGNSQGIQCRFLIATALRPDATSTLATIRSLGLDAEIASGDAQEPVRACARAVAIDRFGARMQPPDKLARLREIQAAGKPVAMLGDGVNDGPVLGGADVAIAVGSAAALARSGADVILLGRSLAPLAWLFGHSHRTRRIIRQNLVWAVGYNLIAVPLAALGLLSPWMAAAGMSLSSLLVVANAIRLQRVSEIPPRTSP